MNEFAASYYLYVGTVLLSTLYAWLAAVFALNAHGGKRLNPLFWWLSFATLWFVMGFRAEVGVDYYSYQEIYYRAASTAFLDYYTVEFVEPGYLLLIYLVDYFYGDFAGLFICSSFVGLLFLYAAFAYEAPRINPAWPVFVFASTHYYYFFGIERLFLAVSIITYGLRWIIQQNLRRYYTIVVVAAMFHVSAVFMLFLPMLYSYVTSRAVSRMGQVGTAERPVQIGRYVFLLCLVPFVFYAVAMLMPYLPARYHGYAETTNLAETFHSIALKVPVAILLLVSLQKSVARYPPSLLYSGMYIGSLFVQAATGIVNVGRLNWYLWIVLCFAFPLSLRACSRHGIVRAVAAAAVIVYCLGYMFHAYLGQDSSRSVHMFPYRHMFFDLQQWDR